MWWIIASLIFLGILLLLVEILLLPGVGVAGVAGLLSMIASCWYAFHAFDSHTGRIVIIINIILCIIFTIIVLRGKTWKRFALNDAVEGRVNEEGNSIKVGDEGKTLTRLGPVGKAEFGAVACEVHSEGELIDAGTPVVVTKVQNKEIFVKPIDK